MRGEQGNGLAFDDSEPFEHHERATLLLTEEPHLDVEPAVAHARREGREDGNVVDERGLVEKRSLAPDAVEDTFADEVEDRLPDRRERHVEPRGELAFRRKRLPGLQVPVLDHRHEQVA